MADKKKRSKMTRKMKRTIRRSVAGVCMVSSLIVAAIPATPTTAYVSPGSVAGQPTSYAYGVEETDSTDLSYYDASLSTIDLEKYYNDVSGQDSYDKTYMIRRLSDGSYDYNWQFKVYGQTVNETLLSIIAKYNDTYASGAVSVKTALPLSYVVVDQDFYAAYVQAHRNAKSHADYATIPRLSGTPDSTADLQHKSHFHLDHYNSANEYNTTKDDYWIARYFPVAYSNYQTTYAKWQSDVEKYNEFVALMDAYDINMDAWDYYNSHPDTAQPTQTLEVPPLPSYSGTYATATPISVGNHSPKNVVDPTTLNPPLDCWVADIPENNTGMFRFFCEMHPDYYSKLYGDEYHLVSVKDSRATGSLTNQYVYIPMGTPNPEDGETPSNNDSLGFRIDTLTSVIGIGAHAFENTTNVTELYLGDEVKYIGDYAFNKSFVQKISFTNVQDIGNRAFKDCTKLSNVDIKDTTVNIGTEAFYGCNVLEEIQLSQSIQYIGPGAFAECLKLKTVDLSLIQQGCNISDFAFFNDISINTIKFSDSIARLGEGCFACMKGVSGNLLTFTFPSHISIDQSEKMPDGSVASRNAVGNFCLAGRTNLQHVVMPADYGKNGDVVLPYGVFFNCVKLLDVRFPDNRDGSCGKVTYGVYDDGTTKRTMFDTIQTKEFCVYGPEFDMAGNIAAPRRSTWGLKSGIGNEIPYIYIDSNGKEQVEISNGQYILIIDDEGVLKSCQYATPQMQQDAQDNGLDLVIPEYVGDTKVTGIDSNCFADETIHPYIKTLKIADNTISEIAPNAFKDCILLESVQIGNSVNKIGNSAFENCPKLTYVKFNSPKGGYASFPVSNIGENAFSTGSDELTIEGDINDQYGPFVWATDINNYVDPNLGTRVCYQTGNPYNLKVIVDNRNNLPTLVDYPHYEQLNKLSGTEGDTVDVDGTTYKTDLITRFENLGKEIYDSTGNVAYTYTMSLPEERLVNATLNIDVPSGIKSIDAKGFINSNSPLGEGISTTTTNSSSAAKYLPGDNFIEYRAHGLFNGYYGSDSGSGQKREYPAGDARELEDLGNDRVESITLHTVEYLPDYAFQSCERLNSLNLGQNLDKLGVAPFTGCVNLSSIGSNSDAYQCENGIVYGKDADGNTQIIEVLSSRGRLVGSNKVRPGDEDKLLASVTEILPGAFEDCDYITGVDLRGVTQLDSLPDDCFKNCDKLNQVILPENVKAVGHDAFKGTMEGVELVVYGEEVYLPNDTFGSPSDQPTSYRVISYKDSAARRAAADIGADVSEVLDETVKVQFMDYDGREISKLIYVVKGESIKLEDIPADPVRDGYEFTGWNKPLTNIENDTIIVATYRLKTSNNGSGDVSGNEGGNGGSNNGGSNNGGSNNGGSNNGGSNNGGSNNGGSNNGGSNNGGDNGGGSASNTFYTLTVTNGNGSGSYAAGAVVIITCTNPPAGQVFDKWVPETNDLGIASVSVAATTLTMPAHNAAVKATFKAAPAGSSNSSSNSGNGTSNNANGNGNAGNTVLISKPGISNTSLASATVNGSTDNYVIRISESSAATQAVEKALINEYGNLDNIKYSAMDISLYDSTGSTKITDTTGLSITITVPIPDALTAYAGNNKVAGVVNERLDKLNPRFTSIDGVPCVTFTATHFSPYTIYVDTGNLTQGTAFDETPKTGDFHPKWILAIGLFALSIALFFIKDKRPTKAQVYA